MDEEEKFQLQMAMLYTPLYSYRKWYATDLVSEGVSFAICMRCGMPLLIDPHEGIDTFKIHDDWHTAQAKAAFTFTRPF